MANLTFPMGLKNSINVTKLFLKKVYSIKFGVYIYRDHLQR